MNRKESLLNGKGIAALAAALLSIALVVCALCYAMVHRGDSVIQNQTRRYLAEVSEQVSSRLTLRMSANLSTLESISDNLSFFSEAEAFGPAYLERMISRYPFHWGGITDGGGRLVTREGEVIDLGGRGAVRQALSGVSAVDEALSYCPGVGDCILYAVPYREADEVVGALVVWGEPKIVEERLLGIETFGGEGFSHIVNRSGDFILRSSNANAILGGDNLFESLRLRGKLDAGDSIEAMEAAMREGRGGYLEYTFDGSVHETMNYVPVNEGKWYLLSVVPTAVYADEMQRFAGFSMMASIFISALFLLVIAGVLFMTARKNRAITRIAYEDPVTGGFTAARFALALREQAERFEPYAFISADLRRFKLVNSSFGSREGDRVLRHAHACIAANLNADEFAARISGDTFNIVMRTTDPALIVRRLEAIAQEINRYNDQTEAPYYLPIDCGVYIVDAPAADVVTIRDYANAARKKNKAEATHALCRCVFYDDMERVRQLHEMDMENNMEQALENGEFVVYLQPKVSLESGKTIGAEALVRWQDPVRGLVPPDEFIPFFERNGFIRKMDLYVFEEVLKLLRRWIDAGLTPVPVSVNMSRAHFQVPHFLQKYKDVQQRYGVPESLLEIELTETLLFENMEYLKQVVSEIHEMGFRCSMDDFGSGYSSLNVLREVQVDTLKLDRAFFTKEDDPRGEEVVRSVVDLAHRLGMTTVSEGVETASQVQFLRRIHCDAVQGFVYSQPLRAEDFEKRTFYAEEN